MSLDLKQNRLSIKQRQYLKALAHSLEPVVMIGDKGLTQSVIKEIEINLLAHELIKIRILGNDRDLRNSLAVEICGKTNSSLVQHIGKILIIYKPNDSSNIKLP
ncbi:MAG TPA: ribosome assembly RNA-binding protein YhbY [Burkholderiales bacterium]|nr:ribosome assembly RNA-binding protein YhbY [Burkholderiales bacterium]